MKMNLKNQKGITLIGGIGWFVAIAFIFVIISSFTTQPGYKLDDTNYEKLAFDNIMQSIQAAQIREDITGTISKMYFDKLGEIVKKADTNYQWFTDVNGKIFINLATDEAKISQLNMSAEEAKTFEILWISYEKYSAAFIIKKVDNDYYLVDYTFVEEITPGYIFEII